MGDAPSSDVRQGGLADPIWYIDASLDGNIVAAALTAVGAPYRRHRVEFPPKGDGDREANDSPWIEKVGREGWVGLTRDSVLHRNALAIQAAQKFSSRILCLRAGNTSGPKLGAFIQSILPKLRTFVAGAHAPYVAWVCVEGSEAGRVEIKWPSRGNRPPGRR